MTRRRGIASLLAATCAAWLLWAGSALAAPAFQAAGTQQSATGNVTVPWPAHQAGDIALLFIESTGGQAANLASAAGFALVPGSPQSTGAGTAGTRLTVYWARATSGAMASPIVQDPGDHVYARILTYRGVVSTGDPWDATAGGVKGAASTSVSVTGVTTTVPDTLVVQAASRDNDSAAAAFSAYVNANLAGIAERSDAGTTSGNGGGFAVWDGVKATAGGTGNTTATVTNSVNAFMTIALKAGSYFSRNGGGDWTTNATWSNAGCNGAAAGSFPTATSDVVICNGHTVIVDAAAAAQSVLLQTGNANVTLTHGGATALTVGSGGVTLTGGTGGGQTKAWDIGAGSATVNGPVSLNGGSNNSRIVEINLTTGTLDINGDLTMNAGSNVRAVIDATGAASIFVSGDFTFNNGTLTPGPSSTFTYDGPGNWALAHSATIQYRHLVVNKPGGLATQSGSTLTVLGDLDVQAGTLNINTSTISVGGNTTVSGTLGFTSATGTANFAGDVTVNGTWSNTGNESVAIQGNLADNGTFTAGTGTYTLNGTGAQTITGTNGGTTTFANLALDNANGLSLAGTHDVTVTANLTLTAGRVTTNANVLFVSYTAGAGAITGASATNFVVGNLRKAYASGATQTRTYEVGTVAGGVRYTPASLTLVVPGGGAGNFTVSSTAGDHPNIASSSLDPALSINRYWTLTRDSVAITTAAGNSITLNYIDPADYDGGADFNLFAVGVYSGGTWADFEPSARAATSVTISGAGITQAGISGDYQVAQRGTPFNLVSATLVCGMTNQVEVVFSRPVTPGSATNAANYALSGGATVSGAVLDGGGQVVTLTTSTLTLGQAYTVTVNNVVAVAGPVLAPNSQATFFTEGGYRPGLLGSYFPNMTLSGVPVQRIDGPVDFDWGVGTPGVAGIGADNFSVRWEGFVTPFTTGNYTFRTRSDDGVRLYVNGALVINNWTDHAPTDNDSAPIALTAGVRYAVTMEFYENGGGAVAQLSWSGPGTGGFQFIPRASLSHFCGLPQPSAFYKLDEVSWSPGAVVDSGGAGFDGTAVGGAQPTPGQVCNGGQFNGSTSYVQVPGLSTLLNGTASLAFWIRTTQAGNDLGWQAPGVTGVELSGGADDIFWGWIDATGRIGVSVGNDYTTKSTVAINNGAWRHVVLTRDHLAGTYKIYIDGALNASGAIATGLIGTPFTSIGRIEDTGGSPEHFNGDLDEVRIYGQVLTDAQALDVYNATRPCPSYLHHVRLEHTGSGVTCSASNVTIRACADASCASEVLTSVTVDLTASPAGTWSLDPVTFSGGNTTVTLSVPTPQTVTLGTSSVTPTPLNSTTLCFNGSVLNDTTACQLTFAETGFLFSAAPGGGAATIGTQVAGTASGQYYVRAVRKNTTTQACEAALQGPSAVGFGYECVDPSACASADLMYVDGGAPTLIARNNVGSVSSYTPVNMTFDANGNAPFTLDYRDVGRVSLHATATVNGATLTGESNPFVVKPAGFVVTGIQRTADSFANPGAADASGAIFMKAGENITLTVTAVSSLGQATPNYGGPPSSAGVTLTPALVPGLGLTALPVLGNGAVPGSQFTNGAATVTNLTWGEVGIITITPGTADYLSQGPVSGTTTGNVGRFTPFDFAVAPNAPEFEPACGAFSYLGQGFSYAPSLAPELTVTARNQAGGTTANYKGDFFRITNASLTGKAYTAAAGTLDTASIVPPDPAIADNGDGTATLTFSSGSGIAFTRTTPVAPFNADISLAINVLDADAVAYATNPARFGQASAGNGIAFTGGNKLVRFGRLRLQNALASSGAIAVPVPVEVQYWDGSVFRTNTLDNCTAIAVPDVALAPSLTGGSTSVQAIALAAGSGSIRLAPPGAANSGTVQVTPTVAVHLRGAWSGGAWDQNPSARASWGLFGGQPRNFIFFRERY